MNDNNKFEIFGSPLRTFTPIIDIDSTYILDFTGYELELPYNFVNIGNGSNSYIDIYIQNKWVRLFPNESSSFDNRFFRHIKIVTNSVAIAEGDLIINVQRKPMDANEKAKLDYIEDRKPLTKVLGALRLFR